MLVVWILLGLLAYFGLGAVLARLLKETRLFRDTDGTPFHTGSFVLLWPFVLLVGAMRIASRVLYGAWPPYRRR